MEEPPYPVSIQVKLRTLGGVFQNFSMLVNGEAAFQNGENVIVFVTRDFPSPLPVDVFTILGGFQGKFTVGGSGVDAQVSRARTLEIRALSNFRREIQGYLREQGMSFSASS